MAEDNFDDLSDSEYTGLTPTDPGESIASDILSEKQRAVNFGLDQDPEAAAEALRLQHITGMPAPAIMADQDGFKDTLRRTSAQQIVLGNQTLSDYVTSNALASVISADDWGNLDTYTQHATVLQRSLNFLSNAGDPETWKALGIGMARSLLPTAGGLAAMGAGAEAGFQSGAMAAPAFGPAAPAAPFVGGFVGAVLAGMAGGAAANEVQDTVINDVLPESWSKGINDATQSAEEGHPLAFFIGEMLPNMLVAKPNLGNLMLTERLLGAAGFGGIEAGQEAYQGQPLDWEKIGVAAATGAVSPGLNKVGEAVEGAGKAAIPSSDAGQAIRAKETAAAEALAAGRIWMENGEDVPAGVHPDIDKAKAEMNSAAVKQLDAALAAVQKTETHLRSPEMIAELNQRLYGDNTIGIGADGALALYGDKPPTPDDGILGWAPNILAQLAQARDGGSDIEIPVRDWLTHVTPEVATALKDHIRTSLAGITAAEAKEPIVPEPTLDAALARVRAASGMEPRFSIGDRPLEVATGAEEELNKSERFQNAALQERDRQRQGLAEEALPPADEFAQYQENRAIRAARNYTDPRQLLDDEYVWRRGELDGTRQDPGRGFANAYNRLATALGFADGGLLSPEAAHAFMTWRRENSQADLRSRDRTILKTTRLVREAGDNFYLKLADGRQVGKISFDPKYLENEKGLWINWVGGEITNRVNGFGPALVIYLKKQIKELYPDKEYVAGYRISGARNGKAAKSDLTHEQRIAKVKLATDEPPTLEDHQAFQDLLATANWTDVGHGVSVDARPEDAYSPEHRQLNTIIQDELSRLVGDKATTSPVAGIAVGGNRAQGVYFGGAARAIFYDLLGPNPQGTARHEAIHALREAGVFTEPEWHALEQAAMDEDWQGRYGIDRKYPGLSAEAKLEEAIAEGFREWAAQDEAVRPQTGIAAIFQKLKDFIDRVRQRLAEALGRDPTADEVFGRAMSGEVGSRPGESGKGGPKFSIDDSLARRVQQTVLDIGGAPNQRVWIKDIRDRLSDLSVEQINAALRELHEAPDNGFHVSGTDNPAELTRGDGPARKAAGFDYKGEPMYTAWQTKALEESGAEALAATPPQPRPVDALPPDPRPAGPPRLTPPAVGLPKKTFGQYERILEAQQAADIAAERKRFEAMERKRQTAEWKQNEQAIRQEVAPKIAARPDIAADQFLAVGRLKGEKLGNNYTLAADGLTPEQRAALPEKYVTKVGLPADMVAGSFGFRSVQEMVDAISTLRKGMVTPEGKPMKMDDYVRGLIKKEVARQMEARFGGLESNIAAAATAHVLDTPQLDLVYADYKKAMEDAGKTAVDKEIVRSVGKKFVEQNAISKAKSYRLLQDSAGQARKAEVLHFNGQPIQMAEPLQKRTILSYAAAEARKLEGEVKEVLRSAKTWRQRVPEAIDPEYTNYIHQIMNQIGLKVDRSPEDLQRQIEYRARGESDLKSFVEREMANGAVIAPWDQLYDQSWRKDFMSLTGEEFRKARDFIKTLVKQGRDVKKVMVEGEMRYMDEVRAGLVEALEKWEPSAKLAEEKPGLVRTLGSRLVQPEFLMDRLDDWRPGGKWNQIFLRPFKEGEAMKAGWIHEVAEDIREIQARPKWTETVDNPGWIRYPKDYGGKAMGLTRENLIAMLLNSGSEGNWKALVKGYEVRDADGFEAWLHSQARPEDWDFVKKVWKVFQKTRRWSDEMYLDQAGVPMQWTEGRRIETRGGEAIDGSYYPLHYDRRFHKSSAHGPISDKAVFGGSYETGIMPDNGYTIRRVGPRDRVALTLDQLPNKIMQQIHDAAMRPALVNAVKILRDRKIEAAINSRLGPEYHELLMDMVRRSANAAAFDGKRTEAQQRMRSFSNAARQSMAINEIGFNLGTVLKHGPTALIASIVESGNPAAFFYAYRQLHQIDDETGESWNQRMYALSPVMRERDQAMSDSVFGASDEVRGRVSRPMRIVDAIAHASLKPVIWSDLLSTKPLWLMRYLQERNAGASIGDAVYAADKAVRKTHGSMSPSSKALIMSDISPWFTMFSNFFNTSLNRMMQGYWQAGVATKAWKAGDMPETFRLAPGAAATMFTAALVPVALHMFVDPPEKHPNDTWPAKMARYILHPASMFFPGLRDFMGYLAGSDSPDVGMLTALYKESGQFWKDWEKKEPMSPRHAQTMMRDFGGFAGAVLRLPGREAGNLASAGYGMATGLENPQTLGDAVSLYRRGTLRRQP